MILSIGMIVKNEEKYLRRCLEALKPVLDEISSELIIADTGSSDKTVEIAKEFTDKVYYFEWCDDYSEARNFTMDKSSGEWFMFVDADEILQNPGNIIDFFKSGKYRQCDWATYIQRNLNSEDNDNSYSDYTVARLCTMNKNIRFKGRIHECLDLNTNRYADTKAVFYHYGYISGGRGFYKKARRYAESILRDFDENNNDFRAYLQLTDAYLTFDLYNALKYSYKAVKKCGAGGYINLLYERLVRCLYKACDYTACAELERKYYSLSSRPRVTDVNISHFLISAYYKSECCEEVIREYKRYKKARDLVLSGKLTSVIESASMSMNISEKYLIKNMTILVSAYTRMNKFSSAGNTLREIYRHENAGGEINNVIAAVFELYERTGDKNILYEFFEFADKAGHMQEVYSAVNIIYRDKLYFKEYVHDIIEILSERGDENIQKFYHMMIFGAEKDEVCSYIALIPEYLYFILKYKLPMTDEVKNYLKGKCEYITENRFNDWTEVLINSLDYVDDAGLIIPICEQIFVFWQEVTFKEREKIMAVYAEALKENFAGMINDEIESVYMLDKVTRFRYLYMMQSMKKEHGSVNIKEIDIPINIYR